MDLSTPLTISLQVTLRLYLHISVDYLHPKRPLHLCRGEREGEGENVLVARASKKVCTKFKPASHASYQVHSGPV